MRVRSLMPREPLPARIFGITGACLLMGLLAVLSWALTRNFAPVRFFFDYPGALFLAGMPVAELCFCWLALRSFSSGEPLRAAWALITLAAACRAAGAVFAHVLGTASFVNPLLWTGAPGPLLLANLRRFGLLVGGPLQMALLAAGLLRAIGVCRETGVLARLKRQDWTLLVIVGAFTMYQLYQVGLAVSAGKAMGPLEFIDLANDPLLCVLIGEAILLRRSVAVIGRGLIGRCWGAFVAAIVLTSLGDMGLWASSYQYIPWPFTAVTWFVWYPVAAAFALAPAYQLAAERRANASIGLFEPGMFDDYSKWGLNSAS